MVYRIVDEAPIPLCAAFDSSYLSDAMVLKVIKKRVARSSENGSNNKWEGRSP